jgi:chromatin remodeling complex protein RSC6
MNDNTAEPTTDPKGEKTISQFSGILGTLSSFRSQITLLQNQVRVLEKSYNKKIRNMEKEVKKNKSKGNRKPSGFAVPTKITNELCDFMKLSHGTAVARTEVTQYIINYIKKNELQWKENRKIIKPDKALTSLLSVEAKDEVTYFNLQKYMNRHFKKSV